LITPEALYAVFVGLKKDASAGLDGVTHEEYQKDADRNIRQLHRRLKDGKYQAQPLRRVTEEIPPVRFDGGPATNKQPDF
jgi:RNA-directed DNA polymerase